MLVLCWSGLAVSFVSFLASVVFGSWLSFRCPLRFWFLSSWSVVLVCVLGVLVVVFALLLGGLSALPFFVA